MAVGNQQPRVSLEPDLRVTDGEDAAFLGASYGLQPDVWQRRVIDSWLAVDSRGRARAGRCGLAVPRQNGKNGILEIVELFKMVAHGRKILHTAHEVKTARKAFMRLASFFENERKYPELAALVSEIRRTNGQEAIILTNGGSCEFVARSRGSGRGFTVDDLVCDEAQELTDEQLEALLPTISAAPSGDPQQFYTGTPPGPTSPGFVFKRIRADGVEGKDRRLSWHEWSMADEVSPESGVKMWRELAFETNPALGVRLNIQTVTDELGAMSAEGFCRERLGRWDSDAVARSLISSASWNLLAIDPDERPQGNLVVGVKFSVDGSLAGLSVAIKPDDPDAPVHIDSLRAASTGEGYGWIADWCEERKGQIAQIVIDGKGSDSVLIDLLVDRGFKTLAKAKKPEFRFIRVPKLDEYLIAHETFLQAVVNEDITHGGGDLLNAQIGGSMKRAIGNKGGWGWQPIADSGNTVLIDSATLAFWGATTCTRKIMAAGSGAMVL